MVERIKDARPMMDLMAKKVFSNPEITAQFIRDILDLPIHHVKILDGTQIHDHQFEDIKAYVTSIDVLAELNDGSQVIIEIQVASQFDFIKRLWLYLCEQVTKNADIYKNDGIETHYLAEKLLPVYTIAITQKKYFNDKKMIRTFSLRDDQSFEELKVYFEGIDEERNLVKMAFLELEKYNKDMIQEYNKVRWIEFFGNKPYTKNPENILEQADLIVKRINWTKEERKMYDERTRYMQAYLGHLAYLKHQEEKVLKRGLECGIEEGIQQGIQQGVEQGKISTIIDLVKNGVISKAIGLQQLNISEELFESYL